MEDATFIRAELVVIYETDDGQQRTILEWAQLPTVANLKHALTQVPNMRKPDSQDDDGVTGHRFPVEFFVAKGVGPPAWRFPKIKFEGLGATIGWRHTAYHVGAKKGKF